VGPRSPPYAMYDHLPPHNPHYLFNTMNQPQRKHIRLPDYDYSSAGAYFITICAKDKQHLFSEITLTETGVILPVLTLIGKIAEEQLKALTERYPHVSVAHYIIMPDHIHMILHLQSRMDDMSPRADLKTVLCAYKSLTTRMIKKQYPQIDTVFQTSYFEHIIRNRQDYEEKEYYIQNNAVKWYYER